MLSFEFTKQYLKNWVFGKLSFLINFKLGLFWPVKPRCRQNYRVFFLKVPKMPLVKALKKKTIPVLSFILYKKRKERKMRMKREGIFLISSPPYLYNRGEEPKIGIICIANTYDPTY